MSALRQLRLVIVGATLGGMIGSITLIPSEGVRAAAIAVIVGGTLLAVVTAADRLSAGRSSNRRLQTLIGKTLITLCATLVVLFAADLLVDTTHGGPARRADVLATTRPAPAVTSQPIAPAPESSEGQALPSPRTTLAPSSAPAGPATVPTTAPPRSSAPTAAASPVTTQAPVAPASAPTTSPPQVSPAPSVEPTPSSAPTSIIPTLPTLPPLPTLPLPGPP